MLEIPRLGSSKKDSGDGEGSLEGQGTHLRSCTGPLPRDIHALSDQIQIQVNSSTIVRLSSEIVLFAHGFFRARSDGSVLLLLC
jgi:hypothetical protein